MKLFDKIKNLFGKKKITYIVYVDKYTLNGLEKTLYYDKVAFEESEYPAFALLGTIYKLGILYHYGMVKEFTWVKYNGYEYLTYKDPNTNFWYNFYLVKKSLIYSKEIKNFKNWEI